MKCDDCKVNKPFDIGSRLCEDCYDKLNAALKNKAMDVESYDENRNEFLLRRSRELGLNYTPKDIRRFIRSGYTDNLILKTKNDEVWYAGSDRSKALPFNFY